jgi:hypothetical protein
MQPDREMTPDEFTRARELETRIDVAQCERDRDVVVALIQAAEQISGTEDPKPGEDDVRAQARAFLRRLWDKHTPPVDTSKMPSL